MTNLKKDNSEQEQTKQKQLWKSTNPSEDSSEQKTNGIRYILNRKNMKIKYF